MRDHFAPLRALAATSVDISNDDVKTSAAPVLLQLAQNDPKRTVKAAAIAKLGNYKSEQYVSLFRNAVNDSSYSVAGNALEALNKIDTAAAFMEASRLSKMPSKGKLAGSIKAVMSSKSGSDVVKDFINLPFGQSKFQALDGLFEFLETTNSIDDLKRGVDAIIAFESQLPESLRDQVVPALNNALKEIQKEKAANGQKDQADYIESKLSKEKGF
jgi:aminopeptidase N